MIFKYVKNKFSTEVSYTINFHIYLLNLPRLKNVKSGVNMKEIFFTCLLIFINCFILLHHIIVNCKYIF